MARLRHFFLRQKILISLLAVGIALIILVIRPPTLNFATSEATPTSQSLADGATSIPADDQDINETALPDTTDSTSTTPTIHPSVTALPNLATPTATLIPTIVVTPEIVPTPTTRPANTPFRVGIQAGHWKIDEQPEELKHLRTSTGASIDGQSEAEVNLDIARRVAALLQQVGIVVDVLPATVPPSYDADAFVAIHADGSKNTSARGFKIATPWRTSEASQHLSNALEVEYAEATGLPRDSRITANMRLYYAFNYDRYEHTIAKTTPAVIFEMGFLTNTTDRAIINRYTENIAIGIANGIIRYHNEYNPNNGAALLPEEFPLQRSLTNELLDVHAAPSDDAKVIASMAADSRLIPLQENNDWYEVVVQEEWHIIGWVRKDQVTVTDEQPTPPPANDP